MNNMVNMDYFDLFNRKLAEFMDDLIIACPDVERQFTVFKDVLGWAIAMDKRYPCGIFESTVMVPYGDQIKKRDENFFLQKAYTEYNDMYKQYYNDLNIVEKLKNVWSTLDDHNKETVWTYMEVLMQLVLRTQKQS